MKHDHQTAAPRVTFFRVYAELNEFLSEARRTTTFPYEFTGTPSIKHTLEEIGVPHPEIDVILVDGESVDFGCLMQGGERVAVYPVFEAFDVGPLVRLRPKPLREPRFVADVHLGKLAQKLRLLGFDTVYRNDLTDPAIVKLSVREHRIILTRDKGVLNYRDVTHGYWVRNTDPKAQLREVVTRLQLEHSFQPFTRCSRCNAHLHPVAKERLRGRVAPDTLHYYDAFVECGGCGKIYWRGSHYAHICALIDELRPLG